MDSGELVGGFDSGAWRSAPLSLSTAGLTSFKGKNEGWAFSCRSIYLTPRYVSIGGLRQALTSSLVFCHSHDMKAVLVTSKGFGMGGVFFGALFFCGWLVSARTVPLLQAVAGKM